MGYLKKKIIKTKKLQKLADSLAIVVPSNWIDEMKWTRKTLLDVIWHPDEDSIIIKPAKENGKKISKPQAG